MSKAMLHEPSKGIDAVIIVILLEKKDNQENLYSPLQSNCHQNVAGMYYTSESRGLSSNSCCFYSDEEDLSTLTSYKKQLIGLYKLSPVVLQALVVCISSGIAYPLSDSSIMHLYKLNVISNKNVKLRNGLHHSESY